MVGFLKVKLFFGGIITTVGIMICISIWLCIYTNVKEPVSLEA